MQIMTETENYYEVIPGSNPTSPVGKNAPVQYIYVRVSIPHIDMQVSSRHAADTLSGDIVFRYY